MTGLLVSFLNRGQLLKGRICSSRSKFFPLRVDLSFGSGKKLQKLFSFVKMAEKHGGIPIHLKLMFAMYIYLFTVRRLSLCEELEQASCGDVLFHGYLGPPCMYDMNLYDLTLKSKHLGPVVQN